MSEMSETEKINSVLFLLYVESKNKNKSELMDIENRLVVAWGRGWGDEMGERGSKGMFPVIQRINHENIVYGVVPIDDNTPLHLWRSWRRLLKVPWTTRRSNQSILKEISPEY